MIATRQSVDRMAADGRMSSEDAATVHAFIDFLGAPTSRCPICLAGADDHLRPSQCPEVSDDERRRYGVVAMDVAYSRHQQRMLARIRTAGS